MNWIKKQFEWIKSFFDTDDIHTLDSDGHNPDSKNLLGIGLIIIFCVAYLKTIATTVASIDGLPDVPGGWQMVILGILGIRALQSGASAYIKLKNGNGKNDLKNPPVDDGEK